VLQKNWQDLIKPEKLVTEAGVDPGRVATIVAASSGFPAILGPPRGGDAWKLFGYITDHRHRRRHDAHDLPSVLSRDGQTQTPRIAHEAA